MDEPTQTNLGMGWHGRAIGLLDLDAFFASVEKLDHPAWKDLPVIVGGDAKKRGVVACASYEARHFGVHAAMPSAQAKRLCPQAIWTHGHFERYRTVSNQVMALIRDITPRVEQVSIDEAFFDITPGRTGASPIALCQDLQQAVRTLGVSCSIGLGTTKTIAKIASEREKPRGLTVVMPGTEAAFLAPLPVRAMSGIGAATEERLLQLNIHTLGELARTDPTELERVLGSAAPTLIMRAQGTEAATVRYASERREVKSISHERTFSHDLMQEDEIRAAIAHVCELCGARLRKQGLKGRCVNLKIKLSATQTHTAQRQMAPTDAESEFEPYAQSLLSEIWRPGLGVRLVGVAISDFSTRPYQLSLWDTPPAPAAESTADAAAGNNAASAHIKREKLKKLSSTTDQLRERFGKDIVSFGRDYKLKDKLTRDPEEPGPTR
ncbi:MAG: DNA polymerase IV [Atopobiaceae bacterium]|jgi:DNA polymerase-4